MLYDGSCDYGLFFFSCYTTKKAMTVRIGNVRLTGLLEAIIPPDVSGDTENNRPSSLLLHFCE